MTHRRPLCFVLMPFGKKPGRGGALIDFDAVFRDLIAPAVEQAGLEPLRADEEQAGGVIHKPMLERLILCEYAVADLTTANANVFYELGLRHGVRAGSTVLVFAQGAGPLPFDVAALRGLPYQLGANGMPNRMEADRAALTARLKAARELAVDSPVYQMLDGFPDIQRLRPTCSAIASTIRVRRRTGCVTPARSGPTRSMPSKANWPPHPPGPSTPRPRSWSTCTCRTAPSRTGPR